MIVNISLIYYIDNFNIVLSFILSLKIVLFNIIGYNKCGINKKSKLQSYLVFSKESKSHIKVNTSSNSNLFINHKKVHVHPHILIYSNHKIPNPISKVTQTCKVQ